MSLVGIGQLAPGPATDPNCGDSPCGVFDYVYLSQACQDYLGCADPTNTLYVGATKGGLYVAGQAAGRAVSSIVSSTASGAAAGISTATGIPTTLLWAGAAIAAFFLLKDFIKK